MTKAPAKKATASKRHAPDKVSSDTSARKTAAAEQFAEADAKGDPDHIDAVAARYGVTGF